MPVHANEAAASVRRAYYSDTIAGFLQRSAEEIVGQLSGASEFSIETAQVEAWREQINILRSALEPYRDCGKVYFEYSVPRVGKRIDVVAIIRNVVFVIEFKVGERQFTASATDQTCDYALDLKNFHETTHDKSVAPLLVATRAADVPLSIAATSHGDGLLLPLHVTPAMLPRAIQGALNFCDGPAIEAADWECGRYCPTPTIIEAALALYGRHSVADISRNDASAINLTRTSAAISDIIADAQARSRKALCLVTGVPGAGKTLVGLNIATQHIDRTSQSYSVFLSGNGPLVAVLCEALARDKVRREKEAGRQSRMSSARSEVKAFVQNVHHFRDDCLTDTTRPPIEHVALFDEAQRAWNLERTADFMRRKKSRPDFGQSEPEFLISCMDRHQDWAVVVCLVGGGQEINTGEAGIDEWIRAVLRSFPHWHVHVSPSLHDSEFAAGQALKLLEGHKGVHHNEDLHLAVSMRSFRAEHVSSMVKQILDLNVQQARNLLGKVRDRYPIVLTRDLAKAKAWLKSKSRGNERFGLVVSSQAQRLKPHAIDVRSPIDPIHWFLDSKEDVRSSYYLEDVATEFHVQGLELDWSCVVWDADFRYTAEGWRHWSFRGDRWQRIKSEQRQVYLKNAYRVLLTRARQGMVIVVPAGERDDPTRAPEFYDATFDYLRSVGFAMVE